MKRILILSLVFVLLLGIINANEDSEKIDEQILEELENNNEVEVVVVLKEEVREGIFGPLEDVVVDEVVEDLDIEKENEFGAIKGFTSEINSEELNDLVQDERVENIYFKQVYKTLAQDSIPLINASLVHTLDFGLGTITGRDQGICILDTGVNYTHPDLGGCSLTTNISDGSCDKVIGGFDFENNDYDPIDDQGHGTHVAGIAAANGGLIGVAPDAFIIGVKVCNNEISASCSYVQDGLDWCVTNAETYNISVISMSLGTGSFTSACDGESASLSLVPFINAAVAKGINVVASSGNGASITEISSPACISNVTAVGAINKDGSLYTNTDRNNLLELLAPGGSINSTSYNEGYEIRSGTSMAAPHLAGTIALLKQYYNDTNVEVGVEKIIQELKETGKELLDSNLTFYKIDAYAALNDSVTPSISFTLSNETVELDQENLIISVDYVDAFLTDYNANVSYPNGSLLSDFITDLEITTGNLTDLGTYTITAWANDTNGNENLATENFLVRDTSGPPTLTSFSSPVNDTNYTSNAYMLFNLSIGSKYNLTNVTLYHNHTGWGANESQDISGNTNETNVEFNVNFPDSNGIYLWGVKACDLNNYCIDTENKTIYVDKSDPVVALVSPLNVTSVYSNSVDFIYNVTDYGIGSCNLIIDTVSNQTSSTISVNVNQTLTTTLGNGDYAWDVTCLDNVDKTGTSVSWNVTVCQPNWDCPSYPTTCPASGIRTRTCTDLNSCGTDTNKPGESQTCTPPDDGGSNDEGSSTGSSGGDSPITSMDTSTLKFNAEVGDVKIFSISKDVGVSGLEFKFKRAVDDVEITVEKQDSKPDSVSAVSDVYKYLKINSNLLEADLEEARIKFKVPKTWITINALGDSNKIILNRYVNNQWVKLETLTAGIDGDDQKYEAITPGFSYFAVSVDKGLTSDTTIGTTNTGNETEEAEVEPETAENEIKENWFDRLTGRATSILERGGNKRYYWIGAGVLLLIILGYLGYRYRTKFGFLGKVKNVNKIFVPFKKINFGFVGNIKTKIGEKGKSIKGKFRKHHKNKVEKEKEQLEKEKEELEVEKKEVEKLKREEEKELEREEKEKRKREEESERERKREEKAKEEEKKEREKEREERLDQEEKEVKKEKKEKKQEKKKLKEKKEEEGFKIKHGEEDKWDDFELEDFDE